MNSQTSQVLQHPYTIVSGGLCRPQYLLNSKCHQRVVLIRDRSGSMKGEKAKDASQATLELVQELALPCTKDGFWVACVDFSTDAELVHDFEKASSLVGSLRPLKVGFFAGSTNITAAIRLTLHQLEKAASTSPQTDISFLRSVVLLFSDGGHNVGPGPVSDAEKLKGIADVVSIAYGLDADEDMLKCLAGSDQHFVRCRSGRSLRTFFAQIGRTLTHTLATRTNTTVALAKTTSVANSHQQ